MNLWFWDDVMPAWREIQPDTTLSGTGTLINRSMLSNHLCSDRLTARLALNWDTIGQRAGLEVVLPQDDAVSVINRTREARLVIAESMHGTIIADAFRIPWIPVAISHHFNSFKWQDWADSMEVDFHMNEALRLPRTRNFGT